MRQQAVEPTQLIFELRTRGRIAVGQVKAADHDAADFGLDIAAVKIIRIAGKCSPDLLGISIPSEYGDPVPALLSVPDHSVSSVSNGGLRKLLLGRLKFLETYDIGRALREPAQQIGQA